MAHSGAYCGVTARARWKALLLEGCIRSETGNLLCQQHGEYFVGKVAPNQIGSRQEEDLSGSQQRFDTNEDSLHAAISLATIFGTTCIRCNRPKTVHKQLLLCPPALASADFAAAIVSVDMSWEDANVSRGRMGQGPRLCVA